MPPSPEDLTPILKLLLQRTGYDFRGYRQSTLQRRITRRLQACGCSTCQDYFQYLKEHPEEAGRLFKDLTIHVTEFFREPEIWAGAGQKILTGLSGEIKIWSAGCASGEEAYSLAIFFKEADHDSGVSVLGTDIDRDSLKRAKEGIYPEEKLKPVSPAVRKKYFHPVKGGYQINSTLKEGVRFQLSDLARQAAEGPFDLISCRNVLIYFSKELQEKVLVRFHHSLRPGGFLWLGRAESLWGRAQDLFECVDKTAKIFRKKN
ncbi:MAG: protein-glutamate O-methyltransferase CheR [Deltaproteobacteria bacterium]|nr:protein-glutamate O-methyltransferase CheR [Deltaproteobacteria bacterium]